LVSPTDKNDIAALLYTGGTTGLPKGAMLTHNNLLANVDSVVHALHLHENTDIFITVLPMFHSFGALQVPPHRSRFDSRGVAAIRPRGHLQDDPR
jgi:long-chain acyl-CoA synthetase